jgi:cytoskeleton protein RodZ
MQPVNEHPSEGQDMSYGSDSGEGFGSAASPSVGDELRWAREHFGIDVEQVSEALRIRPAYLEAIEDSRFDDLPGATYALGFVRTYADYLGLDSALMVRRFRQETLGATPPSELVFPTPQRERHFPGGAVLVLSVVLAAIAYGAWYTMSDHQKVALEKVPPVPAEVAAAAGVAPQPPQPDARVAVAAPGDAAGAAAAPRSAGAVAAQPAIAASAAPVARVAAVLPGAGTPPGTPLARGTAPGAPVVAAPAAPPAPVIPGVQLASVGAGQAVAAPTAGVIAPAAPAAAAPVTPQGFTPQGEVYGAGNEGSRVTLLARLESWVRITDRTSRQVWTRVLREGESYLVPNDPNLILTTGNAGGLEIFVDGRPIPPIGGVGAVSRNVSLDPSVLAVNVGPTAPAIQ